MILGQRTAFDYGEAAGFVAEFCSLGGKIVQREWVSPEASAAEAAVGRLPKQGIDGAAIFSLSGGLDLIRAFAPSGPLRGKIVTDVILGGALSGAFGARAEGVAWAWPAATDPDNAAWRRYGAALRKRFPDQTSATSPLAIGYFTSMEAVLLALERCAASSRTTRRSSGRRSPHRASSRRSGPCGSTPTASSWPPTASRSWTLRQVPAPCVRSARSTRASLERCPPTGLCRARTARSAERAGRRHGRPRTPPETVNRPSSSRSQPERERSGFIRDVRSGGAGSSPL